MPGFTKETDESLLARTAGGDQHAFRILVDRHKTYGMTLASRLLQDERLAEEALQDALLRVYRSARGFRGNAKFTTWFYRILYNVCQTKRQGEPEVMEDLTEAMHLGETPGADSETDLVFEAALARLPQRHRTVVTLFYLQEMSYEEISEICAMPIGTVKTLLHRSREQLRQSRELREHLGVPALANQP